MKCDINLVSLVHLDLLEDVEYRNALIKSEDRIKETICKKVPYDGLFRKELLEKSKTFKWLKDVETILIHNTNGEVTDEDFLMEFADNLLDEALEISKDLVGIEEDLPLIALDLETTGLDTSVTSEGGELKIKSEIVGVCLASSSDRGYYLPVMHTEEDGVKNLDLKAVLKMLQYLVDNSFIIYHNYYYDGSILANNKIRLNYNYADTLLIADSIGMKEWDGVFGIGLKFLSQYWLDRKMLEIHEMLGRKDIVMFNSLASNDAVVYGASDAMNTYGLFEVMVLNADDEDNPYIFNKTAMKLDVKTLNHIISMFRWGLPIDYEALKRSIYTLERRIMIMQRVYADYEITDGYSISSAEQVNFMLGKFFSDRYLERYGMELTVDSDLNSKVMKDLKKKLFDDFGLELKIKKLKNSEKLQFATRKIGKSGVPVLVWVQNNIDKWDFIDEDERNDVYWLCKLIENYRSMITEQGRLGKMYRYAYNDSNNMVRVGIKLNFNGADTKRLSNMSGKGSDRISLNITKTGKVNAKFIAGDGICGINAQGVPSTPHKTIKAKRLKVLPDDMLDYLSEEYSLLDEYHKDLLINISAKK